MKIVKYLIAVLLVISFCLAQSVEQPGTSAGQFLKFAKSAKYVSLGEPVTFGEGDLGALNYNPAGVFGNQQLSMIGGVTTWLAGTKLINVSGKVKTKIGDLAVGWNSFIYGSSDTIELSGLGLVSTGQSMVNASMEFKGSYSMQFIDSLKAGVSLKYMFEKLNQESVGHSFVVDVGAQLDFGFVGVKSLVVGMAGLNLGTPMAVGSVESSLPIIVRGGAEYDFKLNEKNNLLFQVSAEKMLDSSLKFNVGAEYTLMNIIALRIAYKVGEKLYGVKTGVGFSIKNLGLDYAVEFREVGMINHFYFGYSVSSK